MVTNKGSNKAKGKSNRSKSMIKTGGLIAILLIMISIAIFTEKGSTGANTKKQDVQRSGDIIIDKNEVGTTATFYPYEVDGVDLEVMAIKASDGTIRTAFNTCQVCYASGRGYYKQEGDVLVCQNCGNSFTSDDVQVAAGGCNPVPIFDDNKTETDDSITINEAYIQEAKSIFLNWR